MVVRELAISHNDQYFIHPFFSGSIGSSRKDCPVYPYGNALEDEDYRDKFE